MDSDVFRGWCILCHSSISVKKGAADVQKHGTSISHLKKAETQTNPQAGVANKPNAIQAALHRNQVLSTQQCKYKDAALKFEYSLTLRAANHNISGKFLVC